MTIRAKLVLLSGIAVLGMAVLFAGDLIAQRVSARSQATQDLAATAQYHLQAARRLTVEFLAEPDPALVPSVQEHVQQSRDAVAAIAAQDPDLAEEVQAAEAGLAGYAERFQTMADQTQTLGIDAHSGIRGQLGQLHGEMMDKLKRFFDKALIALMQSVELAQKEFLASGDAAQLDAFKATLGELRAKLANWPEKFRVEVEAMLDTYEAAFLQSVELVRSVATGADGVRAQGRELEPQLSTLADQTRAQLESTRSSITMAKLLVFLLAALGVALGAFVLIRSIMGPLKALQEYARCVARAEDESACPRVAMAGELAGLRDDIELMVANLQESMRQAEAQEREAAAEADRAREAMDAAKAQEAHVRELVGRMAELGRQAQTISARLADAAGTLNQRAEDMNQGAEVQRDRIRETATAMEEMNSTVLEVARNSAVAAEGAGANRSLAESGQRMVGRTVDGISGVRDATQELSQVMERLAQQAESIGRVMTVISDIADQTNLLALNAAIEAARAGDAGRGFAVVADEVRKLAEKTMQATGEVGQVIRGIQEAVATTREKHAASQTHLDETIGSAREAGQGLEHIVETVDGVSGMVQEIATAAEQQSATSEEITRSLDEVNRIAESTSESVQRAGESIREVADLARELDQLIAQLGA